MGEETRDRVKASGSGADSPLVVVAVLFADITQLDLTGPVEVLARTPGVHLEVAAATLDPVETDCGFTLGPTTTFAQAPQSDILLVPGGPGINKAILDADVVGFVRAQAQDATWVTSVCTGSLLLGAAGLLRGKEATTHWASMGLLAEFGAVPVAKRVVRDGNIVTGAGVTSGIDFALVLVGELFGVEAARRVQLLLEYDPQPPFKATIDTVPHLWVETSREQTRAVRLPLVQQAAGASTCPLQPAPPKHRGRTQFR
jgi:cyclohexyl-isocyanide hydratase